jgi:hypothetical protein
VATCGRSGAVYIVMWSLVFSFVYCAMFWVRSASSQRAPGLVRGFPVRSVLVGRLPPGGCHGRLFPGWSGGLSVPWGFRRRLADFPRWLVGFINFFFQHLFFLARDLGQWLGKPRAAFGPGGTGQRHDHGGQRCK